MFRRFIRFLFSGWFNMPKVSPLEGFFLRLLMGCVVIYAFREGVGFAGAPHPVGLTKLGLDLGWLADEEKFTILRRIVFVLVGIYTLGIGLPVVLPLLAIAHILPFTQFNSQGWSHHGNQIVSLTLVMQACAAVYAGIKSRKAFMLPDGRLLAWLLIQSQVAITGCYFVSVVTKMDNSGGKWFWNSNYIAVDLVKTERQNYLNELDPQFKDAEQRATWYLERPWLSRAMFSSGVLLEAVCILAIGNRILGFIMGISLIMMHRMIDNLMGLSFLNYLLLDVIFLVGLPFAMAWCFEKIRNRGARYGLLAGILAGFPISYWFHTGSIPRVMVSLERYLMEIVNSIGILDGRSWEPWTRFIKPVWQTCLVTAVIGLVVGIVVNLIISRRLASPEPSY